MPTKRLDEKPPTAEDFERDVNFILEKTRMPKAWLSKLLGFSGASGLLNAVRRKSMNKVYRENARMLRKSLEAHLAAIKNGNDTATYE